MADGEVEEVDCLTKKNTQLPPEHRRIILNSNAMQHNQQNSNPQTTMSGQILQQTRAAPHTIQPVPPLMAQQQTQTNHQHHRIQQQQQHDLQIPAQGSQGFPQPPYWPSPTSSAPYAPHPHPQHHPAQSQVLQQLPPPLFQPQVGGQQTQQHPVIHHQLMQPQLVQQSAMNGVRCHPQPQPQPQLQPPMALLQSPASYSSTPSITSPRAKAVQKKGRFRVVKGTGNEIKKGRFVVKKAAVLSCESAAKSGNSLSSHTNEAVNAMMKTADPKDVVHFGRGVTDEKSNTPRVAVMGKGTNSDTGVAVATAISILAHTNNSHSKKKGRFLVKTGSGAEKDAEKSKMAGSAVKWTDNKGDNTLALLADTSQLADTKNSVTKKKGRFLVKTSNGAHTLAATETKSEAASNVNKTTDEKNVKKSDTPGLAIKGTDDKGDDMSAVVPDPKNPRIKKKGRFLVKTGNGAHTSAATDSDDASNVKETIDEVDAEKSITPGLTVNGMHSKGDTSKLPDTKSPCIKKKGRFLVKTGSGAHISTATETKSELANKIARTTDEKCATAGMEFAVEKSKSDNTSAVLPATSKLADTQSPCTKKKGRFLVRTGGSALNLASMDVNPLPLAAWIASTDVNRKKNEVAGEDLRGKISDVSLEQAVHQTSALSASQRVKKKGRFVVKTGSVTNSPVKAAQPDREELQSNGIGKLNYTRQYSNPPAGMPTTTSFVDANGNMITGMPTTSSFVDVNGHMMVLSNIPLTFSPAVPQHPLQHISGAPVQSATASVGSQTQPQPQSNPRDAHASRSLHTPPLPWPRTVTEERPSSHAHVPRPTRPTGGSGSNCSASGRACPLGGKHGRLIGTGGVGKVLLCLDTLRSEVVEADRSIASLQTDNRFLRDKNKEFEAKISNLERQLQTEKYLRSTIETKYQSLRSQAILTDQGTDANQPQTQSGEIQHFGGMAHQEFFSPSSNSLVFLDDSTSKLGEISENELQRVASTFPLATQLDNDTASEMKLDNRKCISFEDLQPMTTAAHLLLPTTRPPKPPMSDAGSHHASPSMTSLSTIAIQFDPPGTTPTPSVVPGTAGDSVSNVEIPLIVTTTQPCPPRPPTPMGETKYTPIMSNKKNTFDSLSTTSIDMVAAAVACLGLTGLPNMPTTTTQMNSGGVAVPSTVPIPHQQPQRQQFSEPNNEDPFNEIMRMRSI